MVEGLEPGPVQVDSLELVREMAFLEGVVVDGAPVCLREVLLVGYTDRLSAVDFGAFVVCVLEVELVLGQEWGDSQQAASRHEELVDDDPVS